MPQPTSFDAHLDAILTNLSVAFIQSNDMFISSRVFPQVPVDKQSDKYYVYSQNDFLRDEAAIRGDITESVGGGYNLSRDGYFCDVVAYHKDIGEQGRANTDSPLNADEDAVRFVTLKLLINQEVRWVNDYFKAGIWDTDVTPTNLWDNFTLSDPIADINTGKRAILLASGFEPNCLVLGYDVFLALKEHPDFVDRLKYTTSESITAQILARSLQLDRVLVAKAIQATNKELETPTYALTHGKHALLAYVNPQPSLYAPSAGYQFVWRGISKGFGTAIGISKFPMRHLAADRVEGQLAWDNKVVAPGLGYFFESVVS